VTAAPGRIRKGSVTIAGHPSSVTLEAAFWDELRAIAARRGVSLNHLVTEIDSTRFGPDEPVSLSAALRVFVLAEVKRTAGG
jgi:predicted DNA-binding ribbon-helix-helix protein